MTWEKPLYFNDLHAEILFKISSGVPMHEILKQFKIIEPSHTKKDMFIEYLYDIVMGLPPELRREKYNIFKIQN